MVKRELSPAPLPQSKRLHLDKSDPRPAETFSFDNSLYDELILFVFSHLHWKDLCNAQAISRNWARLAVDNELWRKIYLEEYGRTRLRGARGFIARNDGKNMKTLPERASTEGYKDWKWMFRISSNWRTGRCVVEKISTLLTVIDPPEFNASYSKLHILLAGPWTITASSWLSNCPSISVHGPNDERSLCCESKQQPLSRITTLALDQSPPNCRQIRLASFLSTGEFTVFIVNQASPSSPYRKLTFLPARRGGTSPVIHAVYHHPLLISLSEAFTLSIYDLSSDTIRLAQTLTSFTSYPPTSLVLSTPTPATYKLVLAYTIPVYPAHWSVGATELLISAPATSSSPCNPLPSSLAQQVLESPPDPMNVISTRSIRALDVPQGWIDERKLRAMREQWSRKVSRVADTQTDGKWVVLAPGDLPLSSPSTNPGSGSISPSSSVPPLSDTVISHADMSSLLHSPTSLQLYRLTLPLPSASVSSSSPRLTFVRTLHGQTGPVSSIALADGRCVSLGLNGSIWVWDLEGGTGAQVAEARTRPSPHVAGNETNSGTVSFDERRIITALAGDVVVRRFDV